MQKLVDEGMLFWEQHHDSWEAIYSSLVAYGDLNGHCNIPQKSGQGITHNSLYICVRLVCLMFVSVLQG